MEIIVTTCVHTLMVKTLRAVPCDTHFLASCTSFVCAERANGGRIAQDRTNHEKRPIPRSPVIHLIHHGGRKIAQSQFTENLLFSIPLHGKLECSFPALLKCSFPVHSKYIFLFPTHREIKTPFTKNEEYPNPPPSLGQKPLAAPFWNVSKIKFKLQQHTCVILGSCWYQLLK